MNSNKKENDYNKSLKAISLFGGVQFFVIIINLIRSKLLAILFGPSGFGIYSLFQMTTHLLATISNVGLSQSGVKNIAETLDCPNERTRVISIFWKLIILFGIIGLSITVLLSPLLSKWTFGDYSQTFPFVILSVSVLFTQLTSGSLTVFQGLRKYKTLAKANLYGQLIGLVLSIPIYYFVGITSISYVIVVSSVVTFFVTYSFFIREKLTTIKVSLVTLKSEGLNMIKMGILICLSTLLGTLSMYFIRIFIKQFGCIEDVGLYSAGFAMLNSYVGLIFNAMGTDLYPRLAEVNNDNERITSLVNKQIEIILLILLPILCGFIIFIFPIIVLLYSSSFTPIVPMLLWSVFGIFFKAPSWSLSYIILSKGDSKLFFITETSYVIYNTILTLVGYHYFGLSGIGGAYLFTFILYYFQELIVCRYFYSFRLGRNICMLFIVSVLFSIGSTMIVLLSISWLKYLVGGGVIIVASFISLYKLNKLTNICTKIKIRIKAIR